MAVSKTQLELLRPYLVGESAREDGEWDMYCPLHQDRKRSAQLNVDEAVWYCHAGCGGGTVAELVRRRDEWVAPSTQAATKNGAARRKAAVTHEKPSEIKVRAWVQALQDNETALEEMTTVRGLYQITLARFEVGWDARARAYTLPVRAPDGALLNIRRYQIRPPAGRRKIWGLEGLNAPRLYPAQLLAEPLDAFIICEGELDALATNQFGFPALTRTGAASVWKPAWNTNFKGKVVYLCHDADKTGQDANYKVGRSLSKVTDVRVVRLPYPVAEKNGKDLTDWWLDHNGDRDAFQRLLDEATPFDPNANAELERVDPTDVSVIDSYDSKRVGKPLRLTVTIKGKRDPGYSIPRKARYRCTRDAGTKCNHCPLYASGDDEKLVAGGDPAVLEMMDASKGQLHEALRRMYGAVKCPKLQIDVTEHQAVEVLFARPSVDHVNGGDGEYKSIKLTSVGRHDTMPNNTVSVVGALHPDPRRQLNEFLAWDLTRMETSLDRFEMDDATIKLLRQFRPRQGQRPLKKLGEISRDLSAHVTRIHGRPEMHAAMDLVFHSAVSFEFDDKRLARGWLELLVVGDTRTGKSEAATRLTSFYGAGEVVSCEAASFAGIVGGLQQYGASKEWAITWGAIPINDKRLVVLDEVGGLSTEEISAMSSVRSSGLAELTKIQQERTYARTRLIWLGNPREARMSDFTYGVQAIRPLVGNNEDIARFDLALSVQAGDVPGEEINRSRDAGRQRYSSEGCSTLLRWVWSRTADQIIWDEGTENVVFEAANLLGQRYVEEPPLVQVANAREKVARVAVALAARLFSTDDSLEKVLVRKEHVEDAVAFIDRLYSMPGFGYAEQSQELIRDRNEAEGKTRQAREYLRNKPQLAKFLRGAGKFRRQDVEEVLNAEREEANAVISTLWSMRMVRKVKGDVIVEPRLHEILRKVTQ